MLGAKDGAEWRLSSREQVFDPHFVFGEQLDDLAQIDSELVGSRSLRVRAGEAGDVSYVETCLGSPAAALPARRPKKVPSPSERPLE